MSDVRCPIAVFMGCGASSVAELGASRDWFARVHLAGDKMKAFEGGEYSIDQALAAGVPMNGQRTFENIGTQTFVLMDKLDGGVEFLGRSLNLQR